MENKDKPAYPTNARMHSDAQGLTKREMFAMAAMQGLLANPNSWGKSIIKISVDAQQLADSLLKTLNEIE